MDEKNRETMQDEFLALVANQAREAMEQLYEQANLKKGQIVVVGCSTSEIRGQKIGSDSNEQTAAVVFQSIYDFCKEKELFVAAQCCEHLNRAIVMERNTLRVYEEVNVMPQPKAGGAFATSAYKQMEDPILVEAIKADAGLDIGGTLIGMHLKAVAVPLRLDIKQIGEAYLQAARTRPKFIGGSRAMYREELL